MNQKEWNEKERTEKKCKKKKGRILTTEHERYGGKKVGRNETTKPKAKKTKHTNRALGE